VTAETARVLVTHTLPGPAGHDLPPSWEVWEGEGAIPASHLAARIPQLDGLLCMLVDRIDAELLGNGPRLRVVSQMAVGLDNVDVDAATARGIPVGHTPDLLTDTTADTAFALLAAVVRRVPEGQDALRRGAVGAWDPAFLLGGDLHHTTLGIVGLGRIGQAVARRAAGFSMQVLYTGPTPKQEAEPLGARYVPLETLLSSAQAVVLTAPLTQRSRHMIDAGALARMQDGAVLVNVARGGLVDHDALVAETTAGRISAGLDVTEPEPLPADHPLLALPNVVVIPHLGSASHSTRAAMARLAVENLVAGLEGRPLPACANPGVYA
jgi:glyoxylate reductase